MNRQSLIEIIHPGLGGAVHQMDYNPIDSSLSFLPKYELLLGCWRFSNNQFLHNKNLAVFADKAHILQTMLLL